MSVKWLTLHATATIWWDVLGRKMSIAIEHGGDAANDDKDNPGGGGSAGDGGSGGPGGSGAGDSGEHAPRFEWDVELSVGACGLPLPHCVEDTLLSKLGTLALRSFNRINPLNIEFDELEHELEELEETSLLTGGLLDASSPHSSPATREVSCTPCKGIGGMG